MKPENIFILKNGTIKTPPLAADILNGIVQYMELVKHIKLKEEE